LIEIEQVEHGAARREAVGEYWHQSSLEVLRVDARQTIVVAPLWLPRDSFSSDRPRHS